MTDVVTDSQTTPNPQGSEVVTPPAPTTGKQRPREVEYTIEVVEGDLPDRPTQNRSPLEDQLAQVQGNEAYHSPDENGKPRWLILGKYGNTTAATAAKNVLQQRHGRTKNVEGWAFATRRLSGADEGKTGLFASYEPGSIVEGAKAEHDAKEKERLAKIEENRKAREAAKAAEKESGGSAAGSTTADESKAATAAAGDGSGNQNVKDVQAKAEAAKAKQAAKS